MYTHASSVYSIFTEFVKIQRQIRVTPLFFNSNNTHFHEGKTIQSTYFTAVKRIECLYGAGILIGLLYVDMETRCCKGKRGISEYYRLCPIIEFEYRIRVAG